MCPIHGSSDPWLCSRILGLMRFFLQVLSRVKWKTRINMADNSGCKFSITAFSSYSPEISGWISLKLWNFLVLVFRDKLCHSMLQGIARRGRGEKDAGRRRKGSEVRHETAKFVYQKIVIAALLHPKCLVSFSRVLFPETIELRIRGFPTRKNSRRTFHYEKFELLLRSLRSRSYQYNYSNHGWRECVWMFATAKAITY